MKRTKSKNNQLLIMNHMSDASPKRTEATRSRVIMRLYDDGWTAGEISLSVGIPVDRVIGKIVDQLKRTA